MLILNFIVLIFEILFYSMFMYYSKREGKFSRYLLLFSLITIIGTIIKTNYLFSYLILVLMILYGIKYIVKAKTTLYDLFVICLMLIIKSIIEMVIGSLFLINIFSIIQLTFLSYIVKFIFILLFKNKLNKYYNKILIKWNNNNFYIRYIFACLSFIYVIASCIVLLVF